jgi:hypothetical protein
MNTTGTVPTTTCDVYDVAQLAGGLPRVVDTAVVALLGRGRLTVDDAGRLQPVGSAVHPVEAAVLELAGLRSRSTVVSLRFRAEEDPRLAGVADRLVAAGLLRRNPLAGLSSNWPAHLRTAAGRRVLAEWQVAPPTGPSAVALGGPARMTDRGLADAVFGTVAAARRRVRRAGDAGSSGWTLGGWSAGWDGGGGGGWGGDGGGCGGGDGGGGGGC